MALVLARIRNWKLVFFGFFWFFFGLSFGQHSKLETGFWVFLVFLVFLFFLVFFGIFWFFLAFDFRVRIPSQKNQKNPKKTKKKPKKHKKTSRYTKIGKLAWFFFCFFWFVFGFFFVFFGVSTPPRRRTCRSCRKSVIVQPYDYVVNNSSYLGEYWWPSLHRSAGVQFEASNDFYFFNSLTNQQLTMSILCFNLNLPTMKNKLVISGISNPSAGKRDRFFIVDRRTSSFFKTGRRPLPKAAA